uniref:Uncharacterized protein LOC116953235 isoform X3 n=1 Tax=Petromyzon marinus TaxID=7757 RepID=A0AAJ7U5N0_PETMA|nr:uncharacterized protein LOC116953235 isoform X3 [Petromyzon marinus]
MAKRIPSLLDNMFTIQLPSKKGEGILGPVPGHEELFPHFDEQPPLGFGRPPILGRPPREMLPRQAHPLTAAAMGGRHHVEFSGMPDPRSGVGILGPAPGHEDLFLHSTSFGGRELPPRQGRALSPPPPLGLRPPPPDQPRPMHLKHRMAAHDEDYGGRGDDAPLYGEVQDSHSYDRVPSNDDYVTQHHTQHHTQQRFEYGHKATPLDGGSNAGDPYDRDNYDCDTYDREQYDRDSYQRDPYQRDAYDRESYAPAADSGEYEMTGPDQYERASAPYGTAYEQAPEVPHSGRGLLGSPPPLVPPPQLNPYPPTSLLGDPYMPRPTVAPPVLPLLHTPLPLPVHRRVGTSLLGEPDMPRPAAAPPVLPLLHTPLPLPVRRRVGPYERDNRVSSRSRAHGEQTRSSRGRFNTSASDKRSQSANGHGGTASRGRTHGVGGTGDSQISTAGKHGSEAPPEKKAKLQTCDGAKDLEKHSDDSAKAGNKGDNESSTEAAADGNDKNSSEKSLLTMTIQRGESSRAFKGGSPSQKHAEKSDAAEDKVPITCHLCNVTCANNRHFKNHMNGAMHARCMQEVQQKSSVQVAMLLAQDGSKSAEHCLLSVVSPDLGKPASRWCSMCKEYFTCNVVEHRRSQMHKKAKNLTRPYCTICRWNTRSVRKFVEHMSSEEHRQRAQLVQSGNAGKSGQSPGPTEELITVDAVGCYEDGDEEDEEEDEEDEEDEDNEESAGDCAIKKKLRKAVRPASDSAASHDGQESKEDIDEHNDDDDDREEEEEFHVKEKDEGIGKIEGSQSGTEIVKEKFNKKAMGVGGKAAEMEYNPTVAYGEEFVVTVSGLLCHLCQKFYRAEPSARLAHCRSHAHFLKLQKHLQASGSGQTSQVRGSSKRGMTKAQKQPGGEKDPEGMAGEPNEGYIREDAPSKESGEGVQEKDDLWLADHQSTDEETDFFEGLLAQDDDFGYSIGLDKEEDLNDFPI